MDEDAGDCIAADMAAALSVVASGVVAVALAERLVVRFANEAFCRLFDQPAQVAGISLLDLVDTGEHQRLEAALRQGESLCTGCVLRAMRANGARLDVEFRFAPTTVGGRSLVAVFAQDVTQQSQVRTQLSLLAYSDPLTGLANRALLIDRMHHAMLGARHSGDGFGLLALDLDRFKPVNDMHGHAAGDLLLRRIAERLVACLRETDTIARTGGDEFAVLLPGVDWHDDAGAVADRMIEQIALPVALPGGTVCVQASVGIALFPEHASSVDDLLAAADGALYVAKQRGGNGYAWAVAQSLASALPPPLVWDATHQIGVPEIDAQHARLVGLLNELGYALRNAQPHRDILDQVIGYAAFHFASEEKLMQGCGFAGAAQHRAMHRELLNDLRGLRTEGDGISVSLVLRYLQDWLFRHVDGADRDLAAALLRPAVPQPLAAG